MKKIIFTLLACISLTQMVRSQCAYDNSFAGTVAAPVIVGSNILTPGICGGQYLTITGLLAGATYQFETCGLAGWDTQLSLYTSGGGLGVAYNDDACGLQTSFIYTPGASGSYDLLLDRFNCFNDFGFCTQIRITLLTAPPEIDVLGNGISIVNNDITPSNTDSTDFGSVGECTGLVPVVYTINNTSIGTTLNITSVQITGPGAGAFTVTVPPASTVAGGSSTTFTVEFDPLSVGLYQATISIVNDDSDENPYTFNIQGTGLAEVDVTPPVITTCQNDTTVNNSPGVCGSIFNFTEPSCNGGGGPAIFFNNPINGTIGAWTVSDFYTVADDFVVPNGDCWNVSTFSANFWFDPFGSPALNSLTVDILSDAGGTPGAVVSTQTLNSSNWTSTFVGLGFGYYNVYRYDITFPTPTNICGGVGGTTYWIQVHENVALPVYWDLAYTGVGNSAYQNGFALGSDVTFTLGGNSLPTVTDDCGCDTVIQISGLPSGSTYPLGTTTNTYVAYDNAGNTDTCSFDITVVDTEGPTFASCNNINVNVAPGLCGRSVNYTLPVTDNCSGVTLTQIDGSGYTSGNFFPVGNTIQTWQATDSDGNTSICSFNVTVIDNLPPVITGCPSNITVSNTPGNCGAPVTWVAPTVSDNCPGVVFTSSHAPGSTFPVGVTTVTYTATDASGITATCSFTVTVNDVEEPVIVCPGDTIVSNDPGICGAVVNYIAPIGTDNCSSYTEVFNISISDLVNMTNTYLCSGTDRYTCGSNIGFSWTSTNPATPSNISISFNYDIDCGTGALTYNTSLNGGPNAGSFTPPNDCGGCQPDNIYTMNPNPVDYNPGGVNTFILDFLGAGTCNGMQTSPGLGGFYAVVTVTYPGATTSQIAGLPSGGTFPVGTTVNTFVVTDASGNTDTCSFNVTVNDTENPSITCPLDITVSNDPGMCDAVVNYSLPTFTDNCGTTNTPASFSYTGPPLPITDLNTTTAVINASGLNTNLGTDVTLESVCIDLNHTWDGDLVINLVSPSGTTYLLSNGNGGSGDNYIGTCFDMTAATPITSGFAPFTGNFIPEGPGGFANFNGEDPNGNWTLSVFDQFFADIGTLFNFSLNFTNTSGVTLTQINGLSSGSTFPIGTTTNTFVATDNAGNTDTCSFNVTVNDTENPVVFCPSDTVVSNDPSICGAVVNFAGSYTDNCPGGNITYVPASGSTFPVGTTLVTVTATDSTGNTDVCTFNVTVSDTENPVIACLNDTVLSNDPSTCGAVVNLSTTFTDNCPGGTVSFVPPSGSTFPVGITLVTATATDAAGNTDVCTFNVTVNDTENPVITCPGNITVSNDPGMCDAIVNYIAPVGTDNCLGATTIQIGGLANGSNFPVGTTTNVFVVTDAAGNTDTCSFTITVNDTESPSIICPGDTTLNNDPGECEALLNYVTPIGTDNCTGQTTVLISGLPSGSKFPVGTTTNVFVVTDASGNTDTCSFNVTVNDIEPPVITCPLDITVSNDSAMCDAIVNYSLPTFTDNCGTSSTPVSFSYSGPPLPITDLNTTTAVINASGLNSNLGTDVTLESVCIDLNHTWDGDLVINLVSPSGTTYLLSNGNGGSGDNYIGTCFEMTAATPITSGFAPFNGNFIPEGPGGFANFNGENPNGNWTLSIFDQFFADAGTLFNFSLNFTNTTTSGVTLTQINGLSSGSTFPVGTTTNTFVATDASGNTDTCSFNVIVNDTEPPVVNCPNDTTLSATVNNCARVVFFSAPSFTDNCPGGTITQISGLSSGSLFPVGTTVQSYDITDAAGNTTNCSFNIIITDNELPVITNCPSNISLSSSATTCDRIVNWVAPTASDNCGIASFTSSHNPGDTFGVGTTTVTYTATDVNGNIDSCQFTITITDNVLPVVVCQNINAYLDASGNLSIDSSDVDGGSSDNCGIANLTVTPNTFTCSNIGNNTVTLVATDIYGNIDSCTAIVNVIDSVAPVAICQNIDLYLDASGNGSILTSQINNGSNDICGIDTVYLSNYTYSCSDVGPNSVTMTVVDMYGNTSTCNATVTVIDTIAPVAVCQNITVYLDGTGNSSITAGQIDNGSSDSCGISSMNVSPSAFNCSNLGANTVTLTLTDVNGNTSICTATVTVLDTINPSFTFCPSDITDSAVTGLCGKIITYPLPAYLDNCSGITFAQIDGTGLTSGQIFPVGITPQIYVITDGSGNTDTCSFNVTIIDNQPPILTGCPSTISVSTDPGTCDAKVIWSPPVFSDNCPGLTVTSTHLPGQTFLIDSTLVTYTATDASGNTTICSFYVVVSDLTAPLADINPLPAATGECSVTLTAPTATDNCDGIITATTSDPTSYTAQGTYTVTWTYTDGSGNTSTQTQTVIVDDVTAPVADVSPLPVITGECSATVTVIPTATDNCVGIVTATTTDPLTYTSQGTYTVTWTYNDGNGNTSTQTQTVVVNDVTAPVADISPLPVLTGECVVNVLTAPTATDNCAGSVTGTTSDPLTYNVQGTYTITWTYDDGNANISTQTQTVIVDDVTAPVASVPVLPTITGECSATVTTPFAIDNCVGIVNGTTTDPLSYTAQGTYTVTWTYDDGNGNISTQTQTVVVDDITAPVPNVAVLPTVTGECSATVNAPTALDNCSGSITATTLDPTTYTSQGTYIVTWTYDDGNGNITTQTQTVIVDDITAPVPNVSVLNTVSGECTATVTVIPTATDNCDGTVVGTTSDPLTYTSQGTYTVTWTYSDAVGNTTTQTQTVIVDDVTSPVPDLSVLPIASGECSVTISTVPTATDNCTGSINGTTSDPLTYTAQGTYTVTWTYDDGNGNITTQTQTVVVDDITAPVPNISVLPVASGECSVTVTAPTATDNCSGLITATTSDPTTYSAQGTYVVTWTYNDGNGNISTQTETVVVDDITAPIPTVSVLPDVMGDCSATVTNIPTANDNCSGVITATTLNPLTYTNQGVYTITWTYNDGNGNITTQTQNVIVDDVTAPVPDVSVLPDIVGECSATVTNIPTATDNCSGIITATTFNALNYTSQGTYTITWLFIDGYGNTSTQTQNVIVDDVTAPVPTASTLPDVIGQCNATVTGVPTATDNCAGNLIATTSDPLTYTTQGTYTVTWTFNDGNGNITTQTQTVIVLDDTAPVADLTNLPDVTGECSAVVSSTPTATDNCSGVITGVTTDPLTYTTPGTYTVVWSFTDAVGNVSTQTQTVIVTDTQAPVPTESFLLNITGNCAVTVLSAPTAQDNCSGLITATTTDALTYDVPGTYTITWTYDDGNGNSISQDQTVIVGECLGIEDLTDTDWGVNLYPNPSNGEFNLSFTQMPRGETTIRVVDLLGRVLMVKQLTGELTTYDLRHLAAATYYLQIMNNDRQIAIPFIIKHNY